MLRIAQALGLPVVPEVKTRAVMSAGVAFAGGVTWVGVGRLEDVSAVSVGDVSC
jgi:hypothetical protein